MQIGKEIDPDYARQMIKDGHGYIIFHGETPDELGSLYAVTYENIAKISDDDFIDLTLDRCIDISEGKYMDIIFEVIFEVIHRPAGTVIIPPDTLNFKFPFTYFIRMCKKGMMQKVL